MKLIVVLDDEDEHGCLDDGVSISFTKEQLQGIVDVCGKMGVLYEPDVKKK